MKALLIIALAILPGCASIQYAGNASYSVKPFIDQHGNKTCCEVEVRNGKEFASLDAHIEVEGDRYIVDLKEKGVEAFKGQAIASGVTQAAIDAAAKAAVASALAPILPALAPAAGAALASPGIGAAAVGAGAAIGIQELAE